VSLVAPAAVPKTVPPEGDGAHSPHGAMPASPQGGGFNVPATNMWSRDAAAPIASGNPYPGASPSPGLAVTETNPPYQPNGGGYGAPIGLAPRPSGTAIAAGGYGGMPGPGGTAYGGAGTAPMAQPYVPLPVTAGPSGDARRRAPKGTSLLAILLLATGVTGVVVGGVYAASRLTSGGSDKSDIVVPTLPTAATVAAEPSHATDPPAVTPFPLPKTPVVTSPKPTTPVVSKPPTTGPSSQPSAQPTTQPTALPTSTVPILPGSVPWPPFPTALPFPPFGQTQGQTQSPPPQEQPPGGGGLPPGGYTPSPSGGDSPAPTSTNPRPVILRPRH